MLMLRTEVLGFHIEYHGYRFLIFQRDLLSPSSRTKVSKTHSLWTKMLGINNPATEHNYPEDQTVLWGLLPNYIQHNQIRK